MKNLRKKIFVIFLSSILTMLNFQGITSTFAVEKSISVKGYIDLPSYITIGKVNVRSKPSTSSSIVGSIKEGTTVKVIDGATEDDNKDGYRQGWYKVSYSNLIGYVFGDYVKIHVQENTYNPSNAIAVKGIDVSYHQGNIDWKKVKSDGVEFAIIRGGYSTIEDENFKTNIEGAIDAGLDVGVFWYSKAYTTNMAKDEANKCMEVISLYKDKLSFPVYFDFEEDSIKRGEENNITMTMSLASNIAETFLSNLKANGYKSGLYTNLLFSKYYFSENLRTSHDFWIAQYGDKCTYWNKYNMWQYSKTEKVDGINGNVDLNYHYIKNNLSKVSNLKVSKTTTSLKLTWNKVSDATGYEVYKYNTSNKSYKLIKRIKDNLLTTYTDTGLNPSTIYSYKIRSYKDINDSKYYGEYSNTLRENTIVSKVTNLKAKSKSRNSVTLSWNEVNRADGYKIYRLNTRTRKYEYLSTIKDGSTTTYTNSNRISATNYYYKVRAYRIVNGSYRHGSYSDSLKVTTNPLTPIVSLSSPSSRTIKLNWKNISSKTTRYSIYMSTSKYGTYSYVDSTSNKYYYKKNLTKGKTYYFKVRAYRTVDGKKVFSSYSSIKSISSK